MTNVEDSCPECRGAVTQEPVCPGFLYDGQLSHCIPPCGNAFLYECIHIACGWWFVDGMNQRNVLFRVNEDRRPLWLAK